MAKANKHGSQKQGPTNPPGRNKLAPTAGADKNKTGREFSTMQPPPEREKSTPTTNRGNQGRKSNRPRVGGTAIQGAKSTLPRAITTTNPQQQQAESYNRDMRRRMERMGTGPGQPSTMQEQQRKRREKRKQRIEDRRQEVKKLAAKGPRNITLGRRNTYFLIGAVALVVLVIVIAILVNNHILI